MVFVVAVFGSLNSPRLESHILRFVNAAFLYFLSLVYAALCHTRAPRLNRVPCLSEATPPHLCRKLFFQPRRLDERRGICGIGVSSVFSSPIVRYLCML